MEVIAPEHEHRSTFRLEVPNHFHSYSTSGILFFLFQIFTQIHTSLHFLSAVELVTDN